MSDWPSPLATSTTDHLVQLLLAMLHDRGVQGAAAQKLFLVQSRCAHGRSDALNRSLLVGVLDARNKRGVFALPQHGWATLEMIADALAVAWHRHRDGLRTQPGKLRRVLAALPLTA
jgi:hypothetical protein